ncbi:hypothetical protein [Phenylobacterium sp. J367]|uniref:hypothetical protein n=1 Tax=Phenylobacterium sp. J367 TaxID=2898435 RepID=UPI0021516720|nr:hypothetical protein [Phenylobacterium sp. J367]MCR5877102.1 hypothetical protein [Phenylobacterium sp. J367]
MRKLMSAAVAGLAVVGGAAAIATTAEAQRYGGYYYGPPTPYGNYYNRPYDYNRYGQPYGYNGNDPVAAGMAALGSVLGLNMQGAYGGGGYGYGVPVDRYGPDPNGMIGPDGRKIKCKLRRTYDRYYNGYVTRRECWSR